MTKNKKLTKKSKAAKSAPGTVIYAKGYQAGFDDGLQTAGSSRVVSRDWEDFATQFLEASGTSPSSLAVSLDSITSTGFESVTTKVSIPATEDFIASLGLQGMLAEIREYLEQLLPTSGVVEDKEVVVDPDSEELLLDIKYHLTNVDRERRRQVQSQFYSQLSSLLAPDVAGTVVFSLSFSD